MVGGSCHPEPAKDLVFYNLILRNKAQNDRNCRRGMRKFFKHNEPTSYCSTPSIGGGIKRAKSPELAEGSGSRHPEPAKDLVFNY